MSLDPRIARGMAAQLADLPAERIGWKVGFGSPAAMGNLGTDRPLVGFLPRARVVASGATVPLAGWTKPVLEAEVAAYLGADLGPDASPESALAAVSGWSIAIELADLDAPPTDVERILAGNIYHRHVLLGPVVAERPGDLVVTVSCDGSPVVDTATPEALTGELGRVLASTASTLASCGTSLSAGDVVITGSVVPPVDVSGGGAWHVDAPGLGEVSVELTPGG